MDIAAIRSFVTSRKAQGLGESDIKALVKLVAGKDGKLSSSETKQLQRVVAQYGSLFTKSGSATLEKLTGLKAHAPGSSRVSSGSSAVDVRAGRSAAVPRSWDEISSRAITAKMNELIDEGESVILRLKSGREIPVEAYDKMTEFIKKGFFKLYKGEGEVVDVDDNGRNIYDNAWYLVPTPAFKVTEDQLDKHAARAEKITKAISKELEQLHDVMHASNVNGLGGPFDLAKIKANVKAEIPKAKAAIIAYEEAVKKFAGDTQHIDYPNGEVYLMLLAKKALEVAGPKIEALSMRDLHETKDLIRASELLLDRPEIQAVDPGFGIRIQVDTDTLVKNGGDYNAMKAEVTTLLRDALITGEIDFDKNNNEDAVMKQGMALLKKALGASKVVDAWGSGDKDFPDHVRGTEVSFTVKKEAVGEAKKHIDELKQLFAPHGVDMKHFSIRIDADT